MNATKNTRLLCVLALVLCLQPTKTSYAQVAQDAVTGASGGGTPGGSSGQVQYNNSGAFGGFTPSGDATINTGTGAVTTVGTHPGYVSGVWFAPYNSGPPVGGTAMPANRIACRMMIIPRLVTINSLGAGINAVGSSNIQFALYTNTTTSAGNRPGALIGNTGSIANNGSPNTQISGAMAANKQVGPGGADGGKFIWGCANQNDSTASYATFNNYDFADLAGDSSLANLITGAANGPVTGIECSGAACQGGSSTFGSWPANLGTTTWSFITGGTTGNYLPWIFFKAN